MTPEPFIVLHGGGPELALIEYLSRVLLHLLAIGGIAVLALWGSSAVETVRSAFVTDRESAADREEENWR